MTAVDPSPFHVWGNFPCIPSTLDSKAAMQAVMRLEGANIIPFTANNLNILVTAVVSQLPNVTAKDIVISQVRQQSSEPRDSPV